MDAAWGKAVFAGALLCGAAACASFPGDEALMLAAAQWDNATQEHAARRLQVILEHLQVGEARAARHGIFGAAKFVKTEKFLEIGQLDDAVLIARRGAKITEARKLAVIADGDVEISFATAVLVIASGSIRIAHEMPTEPNSGGIYVTRSLVSISHAKDPVVYAAGGAQMSHSGAVTAYNTDFKDSPTEISRTLPGRMFRDEPAQKPRPSTIAFADQSVRFEGSRCRGALKMELLEQELQASLRTGVLPCGHIESASVRCESDQGVTAAGISVERWMFQGCGTNLEVVSRSNPYTRSVVLRREH